MLETLGLDRTEERSIQPSAAPVSGYNTTLIRSLLEALRPYNLEKAEMLMIINLRPSSAAELATIVEEAEERFPEEGKLDEIVEIIKNIMWADGEDAPKRGFDEDGEASVRER